MKKYSNRKSKPKTNTVKLGGLVLIKSNNKQVCGTRHHAQH